MRSSDMFFGLILICTSLEGCTLDRTWFQMSSNSPMPFFGLDFRLPRKTSQVETLIPEEHLAQDWAGSGEIQAVSERTKEVSESSVFKQLRLPRISSQLHGREEDELTFTGPIPPFSR